MQRGMGNWFVLCSRRVDVVSARLEARSRLLPGQQKQRDSACSGGRPSVTDLVWGFDPRGEAGPRFVAEQLRRRQFAFGRVFAEFRVEEGVVEPGPGGVGGAATEINSVEARPVRGGEAHGTWLAACV